MVKNVIIFATIAFYFFIISTTLTYISADPALAEYSLDGNVTFIIDQNTSSINLTGDINDPDPSPGSILDMTVRMFTFRLPSSIVPSSLNFIINFINWILLIILAIVIYRLVVPTTGE